MKNLLEYLDSGFYNNTIFHRVIPGFMVQGGGFTDQMVQKETRDTLAMARTSDPSSATSQFFVNVVDNDFLTPGRDRGQQPHHHQERHAGGPCRPWPGAASCSDEPRREHLATPS
ncbi:cyclophilin family peptidyl-prolyl cis-trans isomerase [Streptomyces sp. PvR034]